MKRIKINNLNEIENIETTLKNAEIISYGQSGIIKLENMHLKGSGTEGTFVFSLTKESKNSLIRTTGNKNIIFILEIDLKKSEIRESTKTLKADSITDRGSDIRITITDFSYEDTADYLRIEAEFTYGFLYGCFGRRIIEIEKNIKIKNLQEFIK